MDEQTASAVYERALAFDAVLTALRQTIEHIEDKDSRERFTKAATDVMGLIYTDIMYPIERSFPQLIPVRER